MNFTSWLQIIPSYITFLRRSHTKYGVHSPFVYDLITKVLQDHKQYPEYKPAEEIRKQCLHNRRVIEISNFGAVKRKSSLGNELKQVRVIARASISVRSGRLLYRLVKYFTPENILELGTSIGISTIYLGSAAPTAHFATIEGCSTTADLAAENLRKAGLNNVNITIGDFSISLPRLLANHKPIGFAFFDGNHTYKATLDYFNVCLAVSDENSVFVFHDIHWSRGMEEAWAEICKHPQVTVSIDLYELGLVFFRKGLSKQDFVIRF
jgi:predicted O-methyltransferase YrrM